MNFEHLVSLNILEWVTKSGRMKFLSPDGKSIIPTAMYANYKRTVVTHFGECFIKTCLPKKFPPKRSRRKAGGKS
jgi:hypothetical protein